MGADSLPPDIGLVSRAFGVHIKGGHDFDEDDEGRQ